RGARAADSAYSVDYKAVHVALFARVVIDSEMQARPVIPNAQHVRSPADSGCQFGPGAMMLQVLDNRATVFFAHVAEPSYEQRAEDQIFSAGNGVNLHNAMCCTVG